MLLLDPGRAGSTALGWHGSIPSRTGPCCRAEQALKKKGICSFVAVWIKSYAARTRLALPCPSPQTSGRPVGDPAGCRLVIGWADRKAGRVELGDLDG